jgi:large subunit ribosomal protein L21
MYAIVEVGGRQWKVEPGSRLDVNRLAVEVGSVHPVERVLLAHDGQEARVGRPYVEGAKVLCEVVEHRLGPKVISYHFRRRENWRKTVGHRQPLTRLLVKELQWPGGQTAEAPAAAEAPKPAPARKPAVAKAAAKNPKPVAKTAPKKRAAAT